MTDDRLIITYCLLMALAGAGCVYAMLTLGFFNWLDDVAFMNYWRW